MCIQQGFFCTAVPKLKEFLAKLKEFLAKLKRKLGKTQGKFAKTQAKFSQNSTENIKIPIFLLKTPQNFTQNEGNFVKCQKVLQNSRIFLPKLKLTENLLTLIAAKAWKKSLA